MKLENQVCSLENGKKLAELGVTMDSYFVWIETVDYNYKAEGFFKVLKRGSAGIYQLHAPAYTVAELGEMLPDGDITTRRGTKRFHCETMTFNHYTIEYTEADARAQMLIWLLENGFITAQEINKNED
jgi:hypothetical protein